MDGRTDGRTDGHLRPTLSCMQLNNISTARNVNLGVELSEVCDACTSLFVLLDEYQRRGNERPLADIAHWVVGQRLQQSNGFFETGPSTCHTESQRCTVPSHPHTTPPTPLTNGQHPTESTSRQRTTEQSVTLECVCEVNCYIKFPSKCPWEPVRKLAKY